ncbi:MAG TPA: hypothetical protein DEP99_00250 [Nitrospiraceae bacterium]|nr:hypothetical protein [Nitrospiraceae bacterium]
MILYSMKYFLYFLLIMLIIVPSTSLSSEVPEPMGYRPLAPDGVFSTFSTKSLKKNQWAFGPAFELLREPAIERISIQAAYGISDIVELGFNLPYTWGKDTEGFEQLNLGLKYRFLNETATTPSIASIFVIGIPVGNEPHANSTDLSAGVILSKRLGPVNGHINLIYTAIDNPSLRDEVTYAFGIDFQAASNMSLLGEIYGQQSRFHGRNDLELRGGYRIATNESIYTTLGIGVDLKNRTPEYRVLVSVTFLYPIEERKVIRIIEEES